MKLSNNETCKYLSKIQAGQAAGLPADIIIHLLAKKLVIRTSVGDDAATFERAQFGEQKVNCKVSEAGALFLQTHKK